MQINEDEGPKCKQRKSFFFKKRIRLNKYLIFVGLWRRAKTDEKRRREEEEEKKKKKKKKEEEEEEKKRREGGKKIKGIETMILVWITMGLYGFLWWG